MIMIRALKQSTAASGFLMVALVCTAGCDNASIIEKQHQYMLDAPRVADGPQAQGKGVLKVRRFTVSSHFETQEFVYRKSNSEYASDFYNRFLAPPAAIITQEARQWLSESGVFADVIDSFSIADYDYMLEGDVQAVYGDHRSQTDPDAVIEIEFVLIDQHLKRDVIIFSRKYRSVQPTGGKNAPAMVEGFNACLVEIFTNLETDLRRLPRSTG